jgi:hypothetical protein
MAVTSSGTATVTLPTDEQIPEGMPEAEPMDLLEQIAVSLR